MENRTLGAKSSVKSVSTKKLFVASEGAVSENVDMETSDTEPST